MASRNDPDRATYIISVAAELAGVHPQTLRVYERKGLVSPQRTAGNTRRYSERDVQLLRRIQELTGEGINLAGVMRILELEDELGRIHERFARAMEAVERAEEAMNELLAARDRTAIVPLKDVRRVRRALRSDQLDEAVRPRRFTAPPISN